MAIHIHIEASPAENASALQAFVEAKASKLQLFLDEFIQGDIALMEEETEDSNNKICTLTVLNGKQTLAARSRSSNFERATLEAIQGIIHQFKRIQYLYR